MNAVESWIASGDVVTLIVAIMFLEIVLLGAWRLRTGRGMPIGELVANSGAGGGLALAARSALVGEGPLMVAVWLLVAAFAHCSFIVLRLRA